MESITCEQFTHKPLILNDRDFYFKVLPATISPHICGHPTKITTPSPPELVETSILISGFHLFSAHVLKRIALLPIGKTDAVPRRRFRRVELRAAGYRVPSRMTTVGRKVHEVAQVPEDHLLFRCERSGRRRHRLLRHRSAFRRGVAVGDAGPRGHQPTGGGSQQRG